MRISNRELQILVVAIGVCCFAAFVGWVSSHPITKPQESEVKVQNKIVKTEFYIADFEVCKIWPTSRDINLTPQIVLGNGHTEYQVLIETAIIKKIGRIESSSLGYYNSPCSDRWVVYQSPKS